MRIIYLDQATYLPPPWRDRFAALGEFQAFDDRPDPGTALARLCDTDLAIVEGTALSGELLAQVTRLRYVTVATNRFSDVDLAAAAAAGVAVAHCPNHSRHAVAEHVFALLLALTRHLAAADRAVRSESSGGFGPFLSRELRGQTLGLVGTGRIATRVAHIAAGFGMDVIAANRTTSPVDGFTVVPLQDVLRRTDVLSLHLPLDASTRGILSAQRLALLPASAVVINTCAGELIDQSALACMLATGALAGAGLDEISAHDAAALRALDNVLLTPGTAWYTETAREANLQEIYDNITSYLAGRPINVLGGEVATRSRTQGRHRDSGQERAPFGVGDGC